MSGFFREKQDQHKSKHALKKVNLFTYLRACLLLYWTRQATAAMCTPIAGF